MDVMKLLEYLQNIIETSYKLPMTGKVVVKQAEILDLIEKIIYYLPDEIKKAQWVMEEKQRILSEALLQAETIKKQNIDMMEKHIETHDITKEATLRAEQIISLAQQDARDIRLGARDYADEILTELEKEIDAKGSAMVAQVQSEVDLFIENLQLDVSGTTDTIRDNIKELRKMK